MLLIETNIPAKRNVVFALGISHHLVVVHLKFHQGCLVSHSDIEIQVALVLSPFSCSRELMRSCRDLFSCCASSILSLLQHFLHHPLCHIYELWRLVHIENWTSFAILGVGGEGFSRVWQISPEQHRLQAATGPASLPWSLDTRSLCLDCWKMSLLANPADFVKCGKDYGSYPAKFIKLGKNAGPYQSLVLCCRQRW